MRNELVLATLDGAVAMIEQAMVAELNLERPTEIAAWNDKPWRTVQEVYDLLLQCESSLSNVDPN